MPRPYAKRVTTVEPAQARATAELLKQRFPWIGTDKSVDYYDECARLVNFTEALESTGKKPDPPRKRTLEERRERVTIIAALEFFALAGAGNHQPAKWLKGGFLRKAEIATVVKRLKGEL